LPTDANYCKDFSAYAVYRQVLNEDGTVKIDFPEPIAVIEDFNTNYHIDELDNTLDVVLVTGKLRYSVRVIDNAKNGFKYPNSSVSVNDFNNYTMRYLATDTIIPNRSTPVFSSGVELTNVGVSSASIIWNTDQDTDGVVEFRVKGSNSNYTVIGENTSPVQRVTTQLHEVKLFGLKPSTEYEYRVVSKNYLGNTIIKGGQDVPVLKTSGFFVNFGGSITTTSTAEVTWSTNLDASSAFIEYQLNRMVGDDPQGGTAGVEPGILSSNPKNHKVVVKGLRSNRTYTFKVKSISTDGFITETEFLSFKTKNFDSDQFTIAPSSSNVAESQITSTTAQIVWQTSSPSTSWVDYGTASGKFDMSSGNDSPTEQHVVVLEGLVPGTTYYYRVRSKDNNELEYTSQEYTFKAILKPKISNMRVKDVTPYSITISWDTNVETETIINWGKTASYGEKKGISGMSKVHEIKVDNLEDNQEYHYQILAKDEAGNEVADEDKVIRTPLDKEGPKIENVKLDVLPMGESDNTGQVIISWTTNKPATTMVEYDEGVIGGKYSLSTVEDKSLNTSHTVIIKDLKPATSYHYRIVSKDKRLNTSLSQDFTFVTPTKEKSILQLIIKSLEDTFAWTRNLNLFFGNVGKRFTGN
jgi:phosphodiesterase/alkaline phosphatase D-like protein